MRGYFDKFPNSVIYFRRIRRFYIIYHLDWDPIDPVLSTEDREIMQWLLNKELGRESEYQQRKSRSS